MGEGWGGKVQVTNKVWVHVDVMVAGVELGM